MTINETTQLKLNFLSRVAQKELKHLLFSHKQVFYEPFTAERAKHLLTDEFLAEKVEAFSSRFCRYQDMLGDKLLPLWLELVGEKQKTFLDDLNRLEKLGIIDSAENWLQLRGLRNKMVHEYIESLELLASALNQAAKHITFLQSSMDRVLSDLDSRGLLESQNEP